MIKYKVVYDREACIGAAACAAIDPKNWEINTDGKADLKGGKEEKGLWVLETGELGDLKEAADACPVDAIKIEEQK